MVTVSRVASASDWLLNTVSGITGGFLGLAKGGTLWVPGIEWLKNKWLKKPEAIAVLILAGLMAARNNFV